MNKKELKELIKEVITSEEYNDSLNTIFEDSVNNEIKKKVTPAEYNTALTALEKLDNRASMKAIEVGDEYFPLDTIKLAVDYLEDYISYFRPSNNTAIIEKFIQQIQR